MTAIASERFGVDRAVGGCQLRVVAGATWHTDADH